MSDGRGNLMISRNDEESVEIWTPAGDVIVVTCYKRRFGQNRIGIEAPLSHRIVRDNAKQKEEVVRT